MTNTYAERFTVVFDGDVRQFDKNPLHFKTEFGKVLAVSACDVMERAECLAADNERLRSLLEEAMKALTPFNDAYVEAMKYVLQGVPLDEDTASSAWVGCINEVSLNDFKRAAVDCKAAGIGGK